MAEIGKLTYSDFVPGKDNGEVVPQGAVGEVATLEVGEDGQGSAYRKVQLGEPLSDLDKTKGRLRHTIQNSTPAEVADTTQIRFVARDKNSNNRVPMTKWYNYEDLTQATPEQRAALPPVTMSRDGESQNFWVTDGRLITIEVRDQTQDTEVDITQSSGSIPFRGSDA